MSTRKGSGTGPGRPPMDESGPAERRVAARLHDPDAKALDEFKRAARIKGDTDALRAAIRLARDNKDAAQLARQVRRLEAAQERHDAVIAAILDALVRAEATSDRMRQLLDEMSAAQSDALRRVKRALE